MLKQIKLSASSEQVTWLENVIFYAVKLSQDIGGLVKGFSRYRH